MWLTLEDPKWFLAFGMEGLLKISVSGQWEKSWGQASVFSAITYKTWFSLKYLYIWFFSHMRAASRHPWSALWSNSIKIVEWKISRLKVIYICGFTTQLYCRVVMVFTREFSWKGYESKTDIALNRGRQPTVRHSKSSALNYVTFTNLSDVERISSDNKTH